jgi:beta-galactosidase/beta-glucuronidase
LLQRPDWLNLNGKWQFDTDPADKGRSERWYHRHDYAATIIVPFTMNASASDASHLPSSDIIWYSCTFILPSTWQLGTRLLHFGACDHKAWVYVNGELAGEHTGGYAPFHLDVTHLLQAGENSLTVRVSDSPSWTQPRGKQAGTTRWPIDYDPIIGLWQTVWLEPVANVHVTSTWSSYTVATNTLQVNTRLSHMATGELQVDLCREGKVIQQVQVAFTDRPEVRLDIIVDEPLLWSPADPALYDLTLRLIAGEGGLTDTSHSYVGLREIKTQHRQMLLNDEPLYLRGVLDQGYFPEGWYSATSDEQYKKDIELTLAMGFNCVRKHQKAEDPRYLYWADRLGLMVWAEMPSGRIFSTELIETLSAEWLALVCRDRGHPCVITWVPFNESWGVWHQDSRGAQRAFVESTVSLTQALDPSRPVVGNDGWEYSRGDLWTLHLYETKTETIAARLKELMDDPTQLVDGRRVGALPGTDVSELPILLTECGGIGFSSVVLGDAFAYGELPKTEAELLVRFEAIAREIRNADVLSGFFWTQLTDVQQEINGVLYFDRGAKLPVDTVRRIMTSI